jgi:2-dehydropantoate 2-reductase
VQKGYNFPYETKTSFQRDFEQQGKSDERDSFAGAILRYAAELNINTPTTAEILGRLERIKPEPNPQKP